MYRYPPMKMVPDNMAPNEKSYDNCNNEAVFFGQFHNVYLIEVMCCSIGLTNPKKVTVDLLFP